MISPPNLVSGDCIGIVSTARKIRTDELLPFLELLKKWNLKYMLGESINASSKQFAGDTALRTRDFQQMLNNPEIKAIWCARGGYGTVQIIDQLDFSAFIQKPKWIIGYSDITVLHSHIHNFGIETMHANMAIEIDTKSEETRSSIKNVLFGRPYSISFSSEENCLNRDGMAEGLLIGGNLSVLCSIIGSPSAITMEGKILFIEDLDEMLYHIDRMMQNLKRNGLLKQLSGLIVGGMSEMRDNNIPYGRTAEEIISEIVSEYDFPVCFGFPTGHIHDNRALIMGRTIKLDVNQGEVKVSFKDL